MKVEETARAIPAQQEEMERFKTIKMEKENIWEKEEL